MDTFTFVDKQRGVYAAKTGAVYICEPNTFRLRSSPIAVPVPFRIITGNDLDPFLVVFSKDGYVQLYNLEERKWSLKAHLPANAGVIDSVSVRNNGQSLIVKSSRGTLHYDSGAWSILSEPLELLIVEQEQKIYAQCTELENEIAAAVELGNFDEYSLAMQKYILCLARYASVDAFIEIWYSMLATTTEFDQEQVRGLWAEILDLLSSMERVAPLMEELQMSLKRK